MTVDTKNSDFWKESHDCIWYHGHQLSNGLSSIIISPFFFLMSIVPSHLFQVSSSTVKSSFNVITPGESPEISIKKSYTHMHLQRSVPLTVDRFPQ